MLKIFPAFATLFPKNKSGLKRTKRKRSSLSLGVMQLEDRTVPSTFSVVNLQDSGNGSLRQAILDANSHDGTQIIKFSVAGTIQLTSQPLPDISSTVNIDGTTAPGFVGAPVVEVDFNNYGGFHFTSGSAGSTLRSLSLVHANNSGVLLDTVDNILVAGNYIGLAPDGITALRNAEGVRMNLSSNNTIGGTTALDRNVISANQGDGLFLEGSPDNQLLGNYIGTDVTGTIKRGNTNNGIFMTSGSDGNSIGGTTGNVISGNGGNGVVINGATLTTVSGNIIGLTAAGNVPLGNGGDGVTVAGDNNVIGTSDPVAGITYNNSHNVSLNSQPVTGWQGIRSADTAGQYLISGTSGSNGLFFDGTIAGVGTSYAVNFPGAANTSVYGPDNLGGGALRLVGSYRTSNTTAVTVNGFLFQGTTADLSNSANYRTIDYPGATYNYVHSSMGGLVVGNYDSALAHGQYSLPLGPGHGYIYDVASKTFLTDVVFPDSISNSVYGIWYNGGTSYTLCGGTSGSPVNNFTNQNQPLGKGFLVDYDSATGQFSHWASFSDPSGHNYITHFEGISSVEKGVYTLNADSAQSGSANPAQGSWVSVTRNADGLFGTGRWVSLNYPGIDSTTNVTSSNSVIGQQVVGIVIGPQSGIPFQATINAGFQLSNVISANGRNGISVNSADNNQIAMNYIGTDITGTVDLGNARNGIQISCGSTGNLIGGSATGGNDPTNGVFVRPPLGNLISGNDGDGVLINSGATQNTLSGNFIGTTASGNSKLGNSLDGVAIDSASDNSLIGCTFQQDPFVFYNVISGNGGNGLLVTNSDDTTIQANFFGIGADDNTAVGNTLNGVVVEGSSTNTVMGGPIPLGNVDAANGQNGIVVQDSASGFTSYNTFCGVAAFSTNMNLGNGHDGILITSTGDNILLRTNVISRNGNDGVEIAGAAQGVRVTGNIIGMNTNGLVPMGNLHNGVEVDGNAHDIVIGGPQPTFNIIPHNIISANGDNGVAIDGNAYNVQVNSSFIGTDFLGLRAFGNLKAGVSISRGTDSSTIGSSDPTLPTVISGNLGNGVEMFSTNNNTVVGSVIGMDAPGLLPVPNKGNGVKISDGFNNIIGRVSAGSNGTAGGPANIIAFNGANGVWVDSGNANGIRENSIYGNTLLGIDLGPWANMAQAAPALTSSIVLSLGTQVSGTITGSSNTNYTTEFFANDVSAASGRYSLGTQTVQTNVAGTAAFTFFGSLPPNGARFVTATATDASDNTSEFSPPLESQNFGAALPAPIANSPASGAVLTTDQPTFAWTAVSGAGSYTLWISDRNTSQVVTVPAGAAATSVTVPPTSALTPGHSFTWWIGAVDSLGLATSWSPGQNFSIAPLPAPTANAPVPGATLATDQPLFNWTAVTGTGSYKVWITDNNTGHVVVILAGASATSVTVPSSSTLTPGHSFTWWVGAVSTNGQAVSWSQPQGFTVAPLAAPTAGSPAP